MASRKKRVSSALSHRLTPRPLCRQAKQTSQTQSQENFQAFLQFSRMQNRDPTTQRCLSAVSQAGTAANLLYWSTVWNVTSPHSIPMRLILFQFLKMHLQQQYLVQ